MNIKHLLSGRTAKILVALLVVVFFGLIFALRYRSAFAIPNFYAEDGTVFISNIFQYNAIGAIFTSFNGYLVTGQYIIAGLAFAPYYIFGLPFSSLPILIALASCLFLGLTAALPFLLFKKQLGAIGALATSALVAFTPMPSSDFSIIGTLGNLKFAFLFWAVLFIIYRNINYTQKYKAILSDIVLLVCVTTNGPIVALLPFLLWPYRAKIIAMLRSRSLALEFLKRADVVSLLVLLTVSLLYLVVVYVSGIPEIPNYLQAPYIWAATDNIVYRVTIYAWLFSVSKEMTGLVAVLILLVILFLVFIVNKRERGVFAFGLFAIILATLSFVLARTGIAEHTLIFEKTPDQFFYAQSMVFIFICMWVIVPYFKGRKKTAVLVSIVSIYILSTFPYGSSLGKNAPLYSDRGDIYSNTAQVCAQQGGESVKLPIYPSETWSLTLDRQIICE